MCYNKKKTKQFQEKILLKTDIKLLKQIIIRPINMICDM